MRWGAATAGLVAAMCASAALAQRDPLATRGGWELGLQAAGYEYDEPFFATLEGERIGVSASYTFLGADRLHTRLDGRYSYARLDYTGSGTSQDEPDHLFELRVIAGRDYPVGGYVWVPYVGLGYRSLYADGRGYTSTGFIGYRRRSHYYYMPLGLSVRIPIGGAWVLAPQLEYDAFANGRQRTYLSDVSPLLPDITNRQTRGRGVRGQLALEGQRWSVSFWSHYWKIKNSELQPIGFGLVALEPANNTHETGIELRYRF